MFHPPAFVSALVTMALVLEEVEEEEERKRRRRFWVHPILANRQQRGQFWSMYTDLRAHEERFSNYTRMSLKSFDELLGLLSSNLERQDTFYRDSIPPAERLIITLRYLATGQSYASLHYAFLVGRSTISIIVRDTCRVIWDVLHGIVMSKPNKEEWIEISLLFRQHCHFPNCVGAIDGKHIRITKPIGSGSKFFNYKKHFSFVLMAVADANYCFRYIDVGSYGSSSDSSIFGNCSFGQMLRANTLDLPENTPLAPPSNTALPFVFVGDEAFALSEHLLRPYSNRGLSIEKRIFNYRLTRARRVVECAFGILANKWRFLHTAINLRMDNAIAAVKAACVLHNYVRKRDGFLFEDSLMHTMQSAQWCAGRATNQGAHVRDRFAEYFMSATGQLPWQMEAVQ